MPADTGLRRQAGRGLWLLGPALVAGVAYLDPGNVAANMTAGARFGYLLVWVVVLANVMAWLIQYLSAKLGLVTGMSLPEILGARLSHPWARRAYWLQAELVAMATDVAEVIGGAVALNLLFGVPLVWGGVLTGVVSMGLLVVQTRHGARSFETLIVALMVLITAGFTAGVIVAPPSVGGVARGLVPRFEGTDSVLLAASILGATVMPHAIYSHGALARDRFPHTARGLDGGPSTLTLVRVARWDVSVAMLVAGTVNLAMLVLAAANLTGVAGTDSLHGAHAALREGLGPMVAALFAVGLLASGLASTSVGAYAGAEIMSGLLRLRLPIVMRRLITLAPALVVLAAGIDPTTALVLSQVVLSFGIPFALVPLIILTARRGVMGKYINRLATTWLGGISAGLLVALNVALLWLTFAPDMTST
ncbi:Nramp family divalent metal transporter [Nesterenkonia halobia]